MFSGSGGFGILMFRVDIKEYDSDRVSGVVNSKDCYCQTLVAAAVGQYGVEIQGLGVRGCRLQSLVVAPFGRLWFCSAGLHGLGSRLRD